MANIHWIIKKAKEFQKNIYFCFIDYAKAFDCVDQNKLWKILQEMETPDHMTWASRQPEGEMMLMEAGSPQEVLGLHLWDPVASFHTDRSPISSGPAESWRC